MITVNVEQGSPEWFAEKVGIPGASNLSKIITTKGEPSKQRTKYAYQLAGERTIGAKEDSYQNAAMLRGTELEGEARTAYEFITGLEVQQVGFCYKDEERRFGCSPDGLIDPDGGLEIKCPSLAVHVEYLLNNKLPTDYFQQVQGSLYITGREWWDFMSYFCGLKPLIVRIYPDEGFHKLLSVELDMFCEELAGVIERIGG